MTDNMRQAIRNQKEKARQRTEQERDVFKKVAKAAATIGTTIALLL